MMCLVLHRGQTFQVIFKKKEKKHEDKNMPPSECEKAKKHFKKSVDYNM